MLVPLTKHPRAAGHCSCFSCPLTWQFQLMEMPDFAFAFQSKKGPDNWVKTVISQC